MDTSTPSRFQAVFTLGKAYAHLKGGFRLVQLELLERECFGLVAYEQKPGKDDVGLTRQSALVKAWNKQFLTASQIKGAVYFILAKRKPNRQSTQHCQTVHSWAWYRGQLIDTGTADGIKMMDCLGNALSRLFAALAEIPADGLKRAQSVHSETSIIHSATRFQPRLIKSFPSLNGI